MYLLIENFNGGMDSSRMALTSRPGTLQELVNCHITRGGEIEKRKAFVPIATLPANTFGLHSSGNQLWTFGSIADPGITQPDPPSPADPFNDIIPRINYMRLNPPGAQATILFPETLKQPTCTVYARKKLTVTMTAHGLTTGAGVSMSIGGNVKIRVPTVLTANTFTVSTNATGSVVIGALTSSSAVSSADTGYTIFVDFGLFLTSFVGFSTSLTPKIYFMNDHSQDGNYAVQSWDPGNVTFSNEFDLPSYTGNSALLTSVFVQPEVYNIKLNVSDTDIGSGGTSLITTPVPWVFDSTYSSLGSRDLTVTAVVVEINKKTSVHGITAASSGGILVLNGGSASQNIWALIREGKLITQPSGIYDRGVIGQFSAATATAMTKLIHAENFSGKIYAIAEFDSTSIAHYYNGIRVLDWSTIALSGDNASVAVAFAVKIRQEGYFTSINYGSTIYINFLEDNVVWTVTGTTFNGGVVNDQTLTISTTAATSTTPQITTVTIGGTYEPGDILSLTIGGSTPNTTYSIQCGAASMGTFTKTHANKMYSPAGSLLYFSETDTNGGAAAFSLQTTKGSGVINMSNHDSGSESLTSLGIYQNKLAIFSKNTIQVWTMNADPTQNARDQVLGNVGTSAPKSVVTLGNVDTYFLSASGIRSLRARDASNAGIVLDIGTAIDDVVLSDLRGISEITRNAAVGIIEPIDGRYWLSVGQRVYVYSYYPSANISAWSVFEPTDAGVRFTISDLVSANQRIYCRSGFKVYAYGGMAGSTYDTCVASVTMPYLDGGKPAHQKSLQGFDSACIGTWDVYMGMDPSLPNGREYVGAITGSSFMAGMIQANGVGTHVGIKMTHSLAEYAKVGNAVAHFQINDAT